MSITSVAGIRFYVKEHSVEPSRAGMLKGAITLVGEFKRTDLWDSIVSRLDGMEIHKGGDIQSELIEILQGQVSLLEKELEDKGVADKHRAQIAEQNASIAVSDKVRAQQHVKLLQAQLDMRTRERDEAVNAAQKWAMFWSDHEASCPLKPR